MLCQAWVGVVPGVGGCYERRAWSGGAAAVPEQGVSQGVTRFTERGRERAGRSSASLTGHGDIAQRAQPKYRPSHSGHSQTARPDRPAATGQPSKPTCQCESLRPCLNYLISSVHLYLHYTYILTINILHYAAKLDQQIHPGRTDKHSRRGHRPQPQRGI